MDKPSSKTLEPSSLETPNAIFFLLEPRLLDSATEDEKPPSKDDEMYYESKEGGRIGKRKYIMKTIDGDDWYGYYVDNLGRRVE